MKTSTQIDPTIADTFDRIFDRWQSDCQQAVRTWFEELNPSPPEVEVVKLGVLPTVPPPRKHTAAPPLPPPQTPNPLESIY